MVQVGSDSIKNHPIAFAEYPAVEDCHDTAVGLCADQPSKALPEAQDGFQE
jgi:hypothetical protein